MSDELKVLKTYDADIYELGQLPVRGVEAEFVVGKHGPFRVKVEKTATWSDDLRRRIDEEAARVRSLVS